jgi:hypothetical protein
MDEELVDAVRRREALLCVGAGVSRSLGLPSFRELGAEMGRELDYDPEVFEQFGDLATLAQYYELEKGGLGTLRSRLDALWHDPAIDVTKSVLHRLILELQVPLIYTTNWDRWLEIAHQRADVPFVRVVGVGDLRGLDSSATQIVKFHGDFSDDASLVLTENSYMRRLDLSTPLDIKLRSDAIGRTVLFIGYSLRDPNTRLLLFRLNELWKAAAYPEARPHSFLVTSHWNPVQERVLNEWGVNSIVSEFSSSGDEVGLAEVLAELVRRAHGKTDVT